LGSALDCERGRGTAVLLLACALDVGCCAGAKGSKAFT
jgi:hypothetical protein